ncbi:VC0807 family protein [Paenibacillus sp. OAS669]|uniref:VC0807 family protein n=1 Tax=Paenibacillus sp. OAS669 TaxID=2663821 RepID=UPI00178B44F8|nr:VC0807 family protein [Paenibacillus sp. OAS669]MBE1441592.1 intracellular septation protein A [Paenibacillus sp. OAS669]
MNKTRNEIIITIILNIVLPYAIYQLLVPHTSSLTALSAAAFVPLCDSLYSLIKHRKADMFSGFIFLGLILGIIAVLMGGDERFILLRESYVTGIMGLLFLVSLLLARPLIYHFAERFTGHDPQMNDKWERLPNYRRTFRLLTAVWGISLLLEACVKVVLVYALPISTFLAVSPIATYGILGLTIWWNVVYVKRIKRRAAANPQT